jgi:hypothetical protein
MILQAHEMVLLVLNYGDLIRPEFQIIPSTGWGQCTNATDEFLIVYGPKHQNDRSIFDTSPYVLPPGATTPNRWDCDGFFVPSDRSIRLWRKSKSGPLAIKFWDFRRFTVRSQRRTIYQAPWNNGVFEPSQVNWAIPNFTYPRVLERIGQFVCGTVGTHAGEVSPPCG